MDVIRIYGIVYVTTIIITVINGLIIKKRMNQEDYKFYKKSNIIWLLMFGMLFLITYLPFRPIIMIAMICMIVLIGLWKLSNEHFKWNRIRTGNNNSITFEDKTKFFGEQMMRTGAMIVAVIILPGTAVLLLLWFWIVVLN